MSASLKSGLIWSTTLSYFLSLKCSHVESFSTNPPLMRQPDVSFNMFQSSRNLNGHLKTRNTSTSLRAEPVEIMVSMYKDALIDNPFETKLVTGGVLAFCGDAIAQSREDEYDAPRAMAFVSFDMVYRALQIALFPEITRICNGNLLSSILSSVNLSTDIHHLATLEQTFANQFVVIPFIYYPIFFSMTGWLQGLSTTTTIERAQSTIFPLLKRNWLFWIPVQYFQFGYVEENLQIPFLCLAGLIWTFILSTSAGSTQKYDASQKIPEEAMERI